MPRLKLISSRDSNVSYIDTGDNYGSSDPSAMNQNPNQYNSGGMGSNTYGSGAGSGPGSGAGSGYGTGGYQDPKFDGWFPNLLFLFLFLFWHRLLTSIMYRYPEHRWFDQSSDGQQGG